MVLKREKVFVRILLMATVRPSLEKKTNFSAGCFLTRPAVYLATGLEILDYNRCDAVWPKVDLSRSK